jgi:hypothetical protein
MIEFDSHKKPAQTLAVHYARQVGKSYVVDFMLSNSDILSADNAYSVAKAFWEITDLAIDDNDKGIVVEGVSDIEFWMYKLFNLVSGYIEQKGYREQWDKAKKQHGKG